MNSPRAKFTMPVMPKVSVMPSAMMPYMAPMMAPFSTWPRTSWLTGSGFDFLTTPAASSRATGSRRALRRRAGMYGSQSLTPRALGGSAPLPNLLLGLLEVLGDVHHVLLDAVLVLQAGSEGAAHEEELRELAGLRRLPHDVVEIGVGVAREEEVRLPGRDLGEDGREVLG